MSLENNFFAPVLLTVYTRLEHFIKTINALQQNSLSKFTDLYIASDAPSAHKDSEMVSKVRVFARSIKGFKSVTLIERNINFGVQENYFDAVKIIFSKSERVIFLQDDVLVGKEFLRFINDGLNKYNAEPSVVGICGYLPPCADNIRASPFFLHERAPYGFGMWRHKESVLESLIGPDLIRSVLKSRKKFATIATHSPHMITALPLIACGNFRAGDISAAIAMRSSGLLALYPNKSLVRNIGQDGTGENSGHNHVLQVQSYSDDLIEFCWLDLKEDLEVAAVISNYRKYPRCDLISFIIFYGYNLCPGFSWMMVFLRILRRKWRQFLRYLIKGLL